MAQPQELHPEEDARRAGVDDRGEPRYRCRDNSIVYLAVRPSFRSFPALVRDVSAGGVGLLVDRPLEPGTAIALSLCGGRPGTSVIRMAYVVHLRRHHPVKNAPWVKKRPLLRSLLGLLVPGEKQSGDGLIWLVGCRVRPTLSPEEIESLRGPG